MQLNHRSNRQPTRSQARPVQFGPAIESLESRQLLSASIAGGLAHTDSAFLLKADSAEQLLMELGAYAQSHGVSSQVASFGTASNTSFTTLLAGLDSTASGQGITLSNTPDSADQANANRAINQSGVKFDKIYTQSAVAADRKLIAEFQKESAKTSVSAIQSYITASLSVLQINLEQAISAHDVAQAENPPAIVTSRSSHVATPTTYSKQGVIEVGKGTTTTATTTSLNNGVITVGGNPFSSAAAQVGTGTANTVGSSTANSVGSSTANSGTGVQTIVVQSNV